MDRQHRMTLLLAFLTVMLALWACTEVTQTTNPSSVDVAVTPSTGTEVEVEDEPPTDGLTVSVVPERVTLGVGDTVFAFVIVKNAVGKEVPNENFVAASRDESVADVGTEGRQLRIVGVAAGETSADVSTNGLRTSVPIVVNP